MIVDDPVELAHLRRAISDHILRVGRDFVPKVMLGRVAEIDRQLATPFDATGVDNSRGRSQPETVSHATARARLGVSKRTMTRRVANGDLRVRGRRVVSASIDEFLAGSDCGFPPARSRTRQR